MSHGLFSRLSMATILCSLVSSPNLAHAADLTWNGLYRVEGVQVQDSELNTGNTDKAYVLHHLILSPKLVVADGLTIYSRLDILNNSTYGIATGQNGTVPGQVSSVAGDLLGGSGPGTPITQSTQPASGTDSNSWGQTERAGNIAVTELYLAWTQEFGQFVVGRVPLQFGLGTAYSAGNGLFDHYISTRDLVGYKLVLGNISVMPMKAKVSQGALNTMSDVDDYMVHLQYENPETELTLGFMYDLHVVTGNDAPIANAGSPYQVGGQGATRTGDFKNTLMSFYFTQKPASMIRTSAEVDLASGDTGIQNAALGGTSLNSFGVAFELAWLPQPETTRWSGLLQLGLATGDDPGTTDVDEGYQFNRNYHVAQLLFRHPLGQADFLRTGMIRNTSIPASTQLDDEAISNAFYFAPSLKYQLRENLAFGGSFIYARLNKDPLNTPTVSAGTDPSLGYEVDLNVTYKPMERLTWITGIAGLLPGAGFRGSSNTTIQPSGQYENKMAFGVESKAAISF